MDSEVKQRRAHSGSPRRDRKAKRHRLTDFNVEAQCTPSRSSILTGRFAIRSGTHSVPLPGSLDGLTQWEVTLAETLSDAGYASGAFGKWHLGSSQGRLLNAQASTNDTASHALPPRRCFPRSPVPKPRECRSCIAWKGARSSRKVE
jgi:arylsulfatase